MICPACAAGKTEVVKTVAGPGATMRWRRCGCGVTFWTSETLIQGSPTARQPPGNQPATARQPPPNLGGVGGGLSSDLDLFRDLSGSVDALTRSQEADRTRARPHSSAQTEKKARGHSKDYPHSFEAVWEYTGKRGTKAPAFKAWERAGRPDMEAVRGPWDAYMLSERPVRGFVKDLSSWLNQSGHTQDWPPAAATRQNDRDQLPSWAEVRQQKDEARLRAQIAREEEQEAARRAHR